MRREREFNERSLEDIWRLFRLDREELLWGERRKTKLLCLCLLRLFGEIYVGFLGMRLRRSFYAL